MVSLLRVPSLPNANVEADWAELSCLFGERSSIPRSEIVRTLDEENVENAETVIGNIWQQINWRHSAVPSYHPITALKGRLERARTWRQAFPYSFMLLLNSQSFYRETRIAKRGWTATAKLFEKLVTEALKNYLGAAINIGAPRDTTLPKSFDRCLEYACQLTKEKKGPRDPLTHWRKDAGVDVIAWKPLDNRSGQVILLAQCAAGGKWDSKTRDINLRRWKSFIHFAADPVRVLGFPSVYSTSSTDLEDRWLDYSWEGGILLDRLRIASLAGTNSQAINRLRGDFVAWCIPQIDGLQWIK